MTVAVLVALLLLLILMGVPIAASIGLSAVIVIALFFPTLNLEIVPARIFFGLDSFVIIAVPLFILLGEIMERSGITDRLVEFANALVGRLRGGMGHTTILTSYVISGISGSGAADAAAMGPTLIPALRRQGWRTDSAAALIAACSSMGPIVPPSILLVIYASITNVSVGKLFIAGMLPGVVMALCLAIWVYFKAPRREVDEEGASKLVAFKRAVLVLGAPLIVIVGIALGVFTATESAAIACIYALLISLFVYRTIKLRDIIDIFVSTALLSARVMFIVACAALFAWVMIRGGVADLIESIPIFGADEPVWKMLLVLNVILIVLGALLDGAAILLIVTPIFFPILKAAGVDPVHLGVIMAINLGIGLVTPPFGTSMFVLMGIAKITMRDYAIKIAPLFVILLAALLIVTYVPSITLSLPTALGVK